MRQGPVFIVTQQPFDAGLSDLLQGFKHVGVQHFRPIGQIEAFGEGILIQLPRLDVPQFDRPFRTPAHEPLRDEFGAIVQPNGLRLAPLCHKLL